MAQIDKNTVKADNQLGKSSKVTFEYEENTGKKILIVGNSITRHAPKAEIGWSGNWGMAASSKDKDYVHRLESLVFLKCPDARFCICQAADWETHYKCGTEQFHLFAPAAEFGADIIVIRLIENCPRDDFDEALFEKQFSDFVTYLNSTGNAKIIIASSFWKRAGDEILKKVATDNGYDFIYLGELGENPEMRADGLFEHIGVAMHPGDKGMETIANLIFDTIKNYI